MLTLAALFLSGCQETPEAPIVIQKKAATEAGDGDCRGGNEDRRPGAGTRKIYGSGKGSQRNY